MLLPARGVAAFGVARRFDLLLLSAVAQPLAALLPYGCGTPLAGAALESERKCSVITCYRWHNIAASAAKPHSVGSLPPNATSHAPHDSKARLIPLTTRRDSWQSHVHRTRFRRPRSSSSLNLPMSGVEGFSPRLSLGDLKGVFSSEREYPLCYTPARRGSKVQRCALLTFC